ncbi:MAG: PEP-utilizing enzyme [Candidatus Andersenbacteria bacterium]
MLPDSSERNSTNESEASPVVFEKQLVRDFSLPIIEAWYYGNIRGLNTYTGIADFNDRLFYLFESSEGIVTAYIEKGILEEGAHKIIAALHKEKGIVEQICKTFQEQITELQKFWPKKHLTNDELAAFLELLRQSWAGVALVFFIPTIDVISEGEKAMAIKARFDNDIYCDRSDSLIRNTISKLYPKAAGFEKYILSSELLLDQIPSLDILKKRRRYYLYTDSELFGDDSRETLAEKYNFFISEDVARRPDEFTGQAAYMGKVRGKVRIILLKDKIRELRPGEILVTSMTTPDYVPAMKIAAAIVTDEGGITCHAAIISRELKKVCVTGTKIATQVLRDGDEIEVDADNGIIRIL